MSAELDALKLSLAAVKSKWLAAYKAAIPAQKAVVRKQIIDGTLKSKKFLTAKTATVNKGT